MGSKNLSHKKVGHRQLHHKHHTVRIPYRILVAILVAGWVLLAIFAAYVVVASSNRQAVRLPNGVEFVLEKVSYIDDKASPRFLRDDMKYALLHVTISNKGTRSFHFSPVLQTYLTDGRGGEHFILTPTDLNNPLPAGELLPGTSYSGDLSYAVPRDIKQPAIHFEPY